MRSFLKPKTSKLVFSFYLCLDISLSTTIQESFGAIRTVRSFAQESHEISRYGEKVEETLKLGLKQAVSTDYPTIYVK